MSSTHQAKPGRGPDGDRFTSNPNNWLKEDKWADYLSDTIDESGKPMAKPVPSSNGGNGSWEDAAAEVNAELSQYPMFDYSKGRRQ